MELILRYIFCRMKFRLKLHSTKLGYRKKKKKKINQEILQ